MIAVFALKTQIVAVSDGAVRIGRNALSFLVEFVARNAFFALEVEDLSAVGQSTDVVEESQARIAGRTSIFAVLETSVNEALALIEHEGSSAVNTLLVLVDASGEVGSADMRGVEVVVVAAGDTDSVLVLGAVDIFFVAFVVGSQKFVSFADQTHFSFRFSAAPTTSNPVALAQRASLRREVHTLLNLADSVGEFKTQGFVTTSAEVVFVGCAANYLAFSLVELVVGS